LNVYDFDKTIFKGDSTAKFYFYCLKRYPKMLCHAPATIGAFVLYALGKKQKTEFKETMYRFVRCIPDIEKTVKGYWEKYGGNIFDWYIRDKRNDDVIISASPEFLLKDFCENTLGVECLMASRVDSKTGKYEGLNCHGEEKVVRFREKYPDAKIQTFCSDSLSDTPLARLAEKSFLVDAKGNLSEWIVK